MSNLLITIISIALVAIAAIVGAWYGGGAYTNAQGKAYANAMASQAAQINNAMIQYQSDTGTGFLTTVSNYCGGGTATCVGPDPITKYLVPSYLQSTIPPDPADWGGQGSTHLFTPNVTWQLTASDSFSALISGSQATYGYFMELYANWPTNSTIIQTCKAVAIIARGASATPVQYNNWHLAYTLPMNPTLDCMWEQAIGSGYTSIDNCLGLSTCWIRIVAQVNASF